MSRYKGIAPAARIPAGTTGNGVELTVEAVVEDILNTVKVSTWLQLVRNNADTRKFLATVLLPLFTTPQLLVDEDGDAILDDNGQEWLVTPIDAAAMVGKTYSNGITLGKVEDQIKALGGDTSKLVNTHLGKVNAKTGEEIAPCLVPADIVEEFKAADAIIGSFFKRSRRGTGDIYTLAGMADKIEFLKQELGL